MQVNFEKKRKKIQGIVNEPPTTMMGSIGNLVTAKKALERLTIKVY